MPDELTPRRTRLRIALFLTGALLVLAGAYTLFSIYATLDRLRVVEAERDTWQRPAEVVRGMGAIEGGTVVDLGCGAGYFALKLSAVAGPRGKVIAVDLRRLSLFFLRLRAWRLGRKNIDIVVATPDDPRLPAGRVDAVLIANTYHEFSNPSLMLDHTWSSLRPNGRVVIVDRGPHRDEKTSAGGVYPRHEVDSAQVESALRRRGFEILSRDDRFIDRPGEEPWWLLVARRP